MSTPTDERDPDTVMSRLVAALTFEAPVAVPAPRTPPPMDVPAVAESELVDIPSIYRELRFLEQSESAEPVEG
jgi:hypothetical protein